MEKQNEWVLRYLKTHKGGLTSWEAIRRHRITRLGARIFDLKERGYNIVSLREQNQNNNSTHARYVLIGNKNGGAL